MSTTGILRMGTPTTVSPTSKSSVRSSTNPATSSPSTGPKQLPPMPLPPMVGVRQDLRTFFYPNEDDFKAQQRRDLFILGFQRFAELPKEDLDSYIQLGSVHGRPLSMGYGVDAPPAEASKASNPLLKMKYVDRSGPVDNVQFSNFGVSEFAYCKHGRPTFMTWHRPYVYLVERAIKRAASFLVENGLIRGDQKAAEQQVQLLRLPYWNWSVHQPVPDVLLSDTIELTQFSLDGQGSSSVTSHPRNYNRAHRTTVKNPFKTFSPSVQQFEYFNGEVPEPEKLNAPQGIAGTLTDYAQNCVFGPEGSLRQPGWSKYLYQVLVSDLRKTLHTAFSGTSFIADDGLLKQSASYWLESAHNSVHNTFSKALAPENQGTTQASAVISGKSTMMNDMSTMDPAFWFHHCFVDCQLAMYLQAHNQYIPPHVNTPADYDPSVYYPGVDPVPAESDLHGASREWLESNFHPWSQGLFPEMFPGQTLAEEREKLQNPDEYTGYTPAYVNSAMVENCTVWGYIYDIMLKKEVMEDGVVALETKDSLPLLSSQEAQEKFLFDFTEDPFLKVMQRCEGEQPGQTEEDTIELGSWSFNDISIPLLDKLIRSATNKRWTLSMTLPRFFKIDNGLAVGRSYVVNVFFVTSTSEKTDLISKPSPTSPAFAGSAAVFSPLNLRSCLNCQKNFNLWPVEVDLTEVLVERGATHLSVAEITERLVLQPEGVPSELLPPRSEWFKDWNVEVNPATDAPEPVCEANSIPVKLWQWKQDLEKKFSELTPEVPEAKVVDDDPLAVRTPKLPADKAADVFKAWQTDSDISTNFTRILTLLKTRDLPCHEHSL